MSVLMNNHGCNQSFENSFQTGGSLARKYCYLKGEDTVTKKKMLHQFQLNCIDAQDDCLICLTEAMGLSVHL